MRLSESEASNWGWSLPRLSAAVVRFEMTGTCDPTLAGSVRTPRPDEIPLSGWQPWKARRNQEIDQTLARIHDAFCQVSLGDGIGLHDARILDDFWDREPPEEYLMALRIDSASHWADTDPDLLEYYGQYFSFTNQKGFRYYAPAYASAWLRSVRSDAARTFCCEQLIWYLASPNGHIFPILSREQSAAIVVFLRTFARYAFENEAKNARYALSAWWSHFSHDTQVDL